MFFYGTQCIMKFSRLGLYNSLSFTPKRISCGISSLLRSVNRILFTVLLVYLILHISPHYSHHLRSHHLSLPRPFTPDWKFISFTYHFIHSLSGCIFDNLQGSWSCIGLLKIIFKGMTFLQHTEYLICLVHQRHHHYVMYVCIVVQMLLRTITYW